MDMQENAVNTTFALKEQDSSVYLFCKYAENTLKLT